MNTPPNITEDQLNQPHFFDDFGLEDLEYGTAETAAFFTEMSGQVKEYGQNSNYQVGAVYFGVDKDGRNFFLPCVNTIPDAIKEKLPDGEETIAGSHMTAHAEMVGMMNLPKFESLSVACHVPFCPTCMEAISELSNADGQQGTVNNLYFDEDSLSDPDSKQKWQESKNMPIEIAKKGQMGLQVVNTVKGWVTETLVAATAKEDKTAKTDNPIEIKVLEGITDIDQVDFEELKKHTKEYAKTSTAPKNTEAVTLVTKNKDGKVYAITATASYPPGSTQDDQNTYADLDSINEKKSYRYLMDALKRTKVASKAADINTNGATIICTKIPTSGMLVNAVQYGIKSIVTRSKVYIDFDKDQHAVFASLRASGVLEHKPVGQKKSGKKHSKKNGHQPAAIPKYDHLDAS